jgi:long-chain acyl-CoA synthetase
MSALAPPHLRHRGRTWSSDEVTALATAWHVDLASALPPVSPLVAVAMTNRPESVALFFALSAQPAPLVVLSEDPRSWSTAPPIPPSTPLVLVPGQEALADQATARGLRPLVLPEARAGRGAAPAFFSFAGTVVFTSGSTGAPKPLYRTSAAMLRAGTANVAIQTGPRGAAFVTALPLATNHGLIACLLAASLQGGTLGLVDRFDHRSVLALFASGQYTVFPATPIMIDMLSRCPLQGAAPPCPPEVKASAGFVPQAVRHAFLTRFGVPPRQTYGTTEGSLIAAETPSTGGIRGVGVGGAVPGVELSIGDDPLEPQPPGAPGHVWFRSSWYMEGYGYPPHLAPRGDVRGWYPTNDLGVIDDTGYLTLLGRRDDCFKTAGGQLVNPHEVGDVLRRHPGVVDAAVVPVAAPSGAVVGVVVESAGGEMDTEEMRRYAATHLPGWAQPQVVRPVQALPRAPSGKIDRAACIALLRDHGPGA